MNYKKYNVVLLFLILNVGSCRPEEESTNQEEPTQEEASKEKEKPKRLERLRKYFDIEAYIAFMNDYRWRGVSQTDRQPAVQGEMVIKTKYGFYGTAWGSYVKFKDIRGREANAELEFAFGNMNKFKDFEYDVGVVRNIYPKSLGESYTEAFLNLTYKPATLGIAFSPSVFNFKNYGLYVFFDMTHEIPIPVPFSTRGVNLTYHFGSYTFGGRSNKFNYFDFKAGINKMFTKHIILEFAFVATDGGFGAVRNTDHDPTFLAIMTIVF